MAALFQILERRDLVGRGQGFEAPAEVLQSRNGHCKRDTTERLAEERFMGFEGNSPVRRELGRLSYEPRDEDSWVGVGEKLVRFQARQSAHRHPPHE